LVNDDQLTKSPIRRLTNCVMIPRGLVRPQGKAPLSSIPPEPAVLQAHQIVDRFRLRAARARVIHEPWRDAVIA
jgi:hypothetical protein